MGDTKIQWTDKTWNVVTGCTKKSDGCRNCWAKSLHDMRHKAFLSGKPMPAQYAHPFETVQLHNSRLDEPQHWRKPALIFPVAGGDLFHVDVPFEFILSVLAHATNASQHTYQFLTKRPDRALEFFRWMDTEAPYRVELMRKNFWWGVSVENQQAADELVPLLLQFPVAVRWLSIEPLLGPIVLEDHDQPEINVNWLRGEDGVWPPIPHLDWVVVGGESGPGARPMHPDWARSLRDQCRATGVPFFFKQWGEFVYSEERDWNHKLDGQYSDCGDGWMRRVGKKLAGRLLDGREWNQMPEEPR